MYVINIGSRNFPITAKKHMYKVLRGVWGDFFQEIPPAFLPGKDRK